MRAAENLVLPLAPEVREEHPLGRRFRQAVEERRERRALHVDGPERHVQRALALAHEDVTVLAHGAGREVLACSGIPKPAPKFRRSRPPRLAAIVDQSRMKQARAPCPGT